MGIMRRQILLNAFKLLDMTILMVAFGAAALLLLRASHSVSFAEFFAMRVKVVNFLIFCGLLVLWHLVFCSCGLYASRRLSRRSAEIEDILKATFFATALLGREAWSSASPWRHPHTSFSSGWSAVSC